VISEDLSVVSEALPSGKTAKDSNAPRARDPFNFPEDISLLTEFIKKLPLL
jgi:hypothetical protein